MAAAGFKRRIMKGRKQQPGRGISSLRQQEEQHELDASAKSSCSQQDPSIPKGPSKKATFATGSTSFSSKVQGAVQDLMSQQSAKISSVNSGEYKTWTSP